MALKTFRCMSLNEVRNNRKQ